MFSKCGGRPEMRDRTWDLSTVSQMCEALYHPPNGSTHSKILSSQPLTKSWDEGSAYHNHILIFMYRYHKAWAGPLCSWSGIFSNLLPLYVLAFAGTVWRLCGLSLLWENLAEHTPFLFATKIIWLTATFGTFGNVLKIYKCHSRAVPPIMHFLVCHSQGVHACSCR